jgi:hypothetical protein
MADDKRPPLESDGDDAEPESPDEPADVDELLDEARQARDQPSSGAGDVPPDQLDAEQEVQGFEDVAVPGTVAGEGIDSELAELEEVEDVDEATFEDVDMEDVDVPEAEVDEELEQVEVPDHEAEDVLEGVDVPDSEAARSWETVDVPEADIGEDE